MASQPIVKAAKQLTAEIINRDFFDLKRLFTMQDLVNARVHLGHKENMLNPHMRPYIYGNRHGVSVIDLNQTRDLLRLALNFTAEISFRGGIVMFLNGSSQTARMVELAAKDCGEYAMTRKWNPGILTDSQAIFGSITRLPDLIIFFNTFDKVNLPHPAIIAAAKMLIPTVGICDSNADPVLITYPVPGNDDTPAAIELYCSLFKTAVLRGKNKRQDMIEKDGSSIDEQAHLE